MYVFDTIESTNLLFLYVLETHCNCLNTNVLNCKKKINIINSSSTFFYIFVIDNDIKRQVKIIIRKYEEKQVYLLISFGMKDSLSLFFV